MRCCGVSGVSGLGFVVSDISSSAKIVLGIERLATMQPLGQPGYPAAAVTGFADVWKF